MNGSTSTETLPLRVKNLTPGTQVTAVFRFINERSDRYIEVRTAFALLTVYVNGEEEYSFGEADERPSYMKDPGTAIHMVPVDETGEVTITLQYTSPNTRSSVSIPQLRVSNQSGLVRYHMITMMGLMAGSTIMMLAGMIVIFVSLIVIHMDRSGVLLLWLGAFMALTGLWGFSNCDMALFLINDPNLWYVVSYISFFSLALPLELLLENSVKFHQKKPLLALRFFLMASMLACIILQMTGTVMFTQSTRLYQILIPVSIFSFTVAVIAEAIRYKNKAGMLWVGPMLILSVACILEIIHYSDSIVYSSSTYFIFGGMIFCVFMSLIGGLQIRKSIQVSRREKEQESAPVIRNASNFFFINIFLH